MERYFFLTILLMGSFGCSKSSDISGNSQAQKFSNIEKSGIGIMTFNTKWLLASAEQAQRLKGKGIWGLEDKDEDTEIEQQHAAVSEVIANYVPDLLCLQEVINRDSADRLIRTLKQGGLDYELGFMESRESYLEQDVAFLINKNSAVFNEIKVRHPKDPINPSKCLILTCKMNGVDTAFVGLHLKSVPTKESSVELREKQADAVVAELIALDQSGYETFVLGDFNDWDPVVPDADGSPEATPVSNVMRKIKDYKTGGDRELMNIMRFIKPVSQRFTFDYHGSETALDHILIPTAFAGKITEAVIPKEVGEDASDHLPVLIRLGIGLETEVYLSPDPISEVPIVDRRQVGNNHNELVAPSSGLLRIVSLVPNPEGKDSGREQLTIQNTSDRDVSLRGWSLMDAAKHRLNLAGTLPAKSKKVIVLKAEEMPLNNDGDTIKLLNQGAEVQQVRYGAGQAGSGVRLLVR